jgi:hypothetical protein
LTYLCPIISAFLAELSDDKLLLHHLDFFVEALEMQVVELVYMLEEDPGRSKGCPI